MWKSIYELKFNGKYLILVCNNSTMEYNCKLLLVSYVEFATIDIFN